jgi:hypothetical protein
MALNSHFKIIQNITDQVERQEKLAFLCGMQKFFPYGFACFTDQDISFIAVLLRSC